LTRKYAEILLHRTASPVSALRLSDQFHSVMEDTVLARVAALQAMSTPKLPARQRTDCLRRDGPRKRWQLAGRGHVVIA